MPTSRTLIQNFFVLAISLVSSFALAQSETEKAKTAEPVTDKKAESSTSAPPKAAKDTPAATPVKEAAPPTTTPPASSPPPATAPKTPDLAPLPNQPPPPTPSAAETPAPVTPLPSSGAVPATPFVKSQPTTSTSSSKQFVVHGSDLKTRSLYTDWADNTSNSLRRLLRDNSNELPTPIVINLRSGADASLIGPAVTTQVSQLSYGGFHLQITVNVRSTHKRSEFEAELIRLLVAERILREHKELKTSRSKILPDWLLTGIIQAQEYRRSAQPSLVFASVFKSGQIYGIDQILIADPRQMDSLNKVIYEASACALVLTLLDQSEGSSRFATFLNALATDSREDRELLLSFFPTLGSSSNSLEKWWSLQMAMLATPTVLETMSIKETEDSLTQALLIRYTDSETEQKESKKALAKTAPRSATPQEEPMPVFEEMEDEKGDRRFFGLFKRKSDQEASVPPAKIMIPAEIEALAKPGVSPSSPPPTAPEEKAAPAEEVSEEEKKGLLNLPNFLKSPFGKKKDVFLPFLKKKDAAEEEIPDVAAPETPAPSSESSPPDILKRKPNSMRGVSKKPKGTATETPTPPRAPVRSIADKPKPPTEELPIPIPSLSPEMGNESAFPFPPGMLPPLQNGEDPQPGTLPDSAPPSIPGFPSFQLPPPQEETLALTPEDFTEPHAIELTEYRKIWSRKDRNAILRKNIQLLNGVKQRAHPLYRSLIASYTEIFVLLSTGKDKNIETSIQSLAQERAKIHELAKAVETQLDWFEANHTQHYSGSFEEYLRVRDKIEEEIKPRRDQVSKYLDTIAKEYE